LVRGLLVLLFVVVALLWAAAMVVVDLPTFWRAVPTVGLLAGALFVASTEWRPRSVTLLALAAVVLTAFITLSVGRPEREGTEALGELEHLAAATQLLGSLEPAGPTTGSTPVWDSILQACALVVTESTGDDGRCPDGVTHLHVISATAATAPGTLRVAMANARLRLAEFRQDVLRQPESVAEVDAAIAALAIDQQAPASAVDALRAGGDAIAESVLGSDPPVVLETAGWVVVIFVALLFWRAIIKRSFSELAGPVTVSLNPGAQRSATEAEVKISGAAQLAAFRVAVLRNVTEPGALPGAAALQSLTDLLEVPGVDGWFAPVVSAVKTILAVPRGFKVTADVVPPDPSSDGQWTVLVRVSDLDSGKDVDVSTQTGASDLNACRSAGIWAAAVVLGRSTRIPSWASWDSQTSTALALYEEPDSETASRLAQALAEAPSSGVLLQKLAAAYILNRQWLDSISMSARAVAAHPRYHVARYRLASGINLLADRIEDWLTAPLAERIRIVEQIDRALAAIRVAEPTLLSTIRTACVPPASAAEGGSTEKDVVDAFRKLARALFERYRRDLSLPHTMIRSLRRQERDIWCFGEIVGRRPIRVLSLWTVRSALLICDSRAGARRADYDRVVRQARKPSSHYQLSYNLACYWSRRGDVNEALTWLETSLERANSWQLTHRWLEKDPGLDRISGTARFSWVAGQVRSGDGQTDGKFDEEEAGDAHEVQAAGVRRGERRRDARVG